MRGGRAVVEAVQLMTLDHALKSCAVYAEQSRCRLLIAARSRKHSRDVEALNHRKREQFRIIGLFCRWRMHLSSGQRCSRTVAYAFGQIFRTHDTITKRDGTHHSVLKLAYVTGPVVLFEQLKRFRRETNRRW